MKALVIEAGRLKLTELPVEPLDNGEVRVRVRATGICATDLHILSGRIKFEKTPRILGHEIAGIVETVGKGVSPDWIGKNVIVDPVIGCGLCAWCHAGRKLLCRNGGELGTTGGDGGCRICDGARNKSLRSPGPLSFEEGALIEPLNCTAGVLQSPAAPGESVLIFGSGRRAVVPGTGRACVAGRFVVGEALRDSSWAGNSARQKRGIIAMVNLPGKSFARRTEKAPTSRLKLRARMSPCVRRSTGFGAADASCSTEFPAHIRRTFPRT
jgi:Zn-dependent alcohol dehydrogenase